MKSRIWLIFFTYPLLGAESVVGQNPPSQSVDRPAAGRPDPIMSVLDTDQDGVISAAELRSAPAALKGLDKNGDGRLSRDEASAPGRNANAGRLDRGRSAGGALGGYRVPPPANQVPAQLFDIVLGRPTDHSVTVRVLAYNDMEGFLAYGTRRGQYAAKTPVVTLTTGEPTDLVLDSLRTNTRYFYQWNYREPGAESFERGGEYTFHTQRAAGSPFTFTVQADSHLDENTSGDVYLRTLANALADQPDFHIELGDTFMTGKYVRPELSLGQYLAQRYYLGHLCHSAPFFFVLGNHDGESGSRGSMLWATRTRKKYFANPFPDDFYSGNRQIEDGIGFPEDYYAWQWGDCQFIVLDPFRYTMGRLRGGDNWHWTLGKTQYDWLKDELENSQATFRFVLLHHLVGGADRNSRGGVEAAPFFEWGGKSSDGTYDFDRQRPGWDKPIHQMLVDHGATIVFHGHDHLFAKQDLGGIVYQLVPQPGHPRFGNVRTAQEYGYLSGEIQSSSGYMRVHVIEDAVRVDYVRTYLPHSESTSRVNGQVAYSYRIPAK